MRSRQKVQGLGGVEKLPGVRSVLPAKSSRGGRERRRRVSHHVSAGRSRTHAEAGARVVHVLRPLPQAQLLCCAAHLRDSKYPQQINQLAAADVQHCHSTVALQATWRMAVH